MKMEIFVQNVKRCCDAKGVKPTNACKESGLGSSFLSDIIHRGRIPSVLNVQTLARYLGVTTSELLGEEPPDKEKPTPEDGDGLSGDQKYLIDAVRAMSASDARKLRVIVEAVIAPQGQ